MPLVMVVVVSAFVTVCAVPGVDVLALKLPSPTYEAVSDLVPAVVSVMLHMPTATLAVQLSTPSLTVTFPVGVPLPGAVTVTL